MSLPNIYPIAPQDASYPPLLRQVADLKGPLFARGHLEALQKSCISVVGTRKMTEYGRRVIDMLVPDLVRAGLAIVSGLAYGVDAYAHQVALTHNGTCIAVLAHGLDRVYPAVHRSLFHQILTEGVVISEHPAGIKPEKSYFPARNRIVAGISPVTLIIEAGETSGTLITVRWALQYGREVCVIPGDITRPQSQGILKLLKDGARPVSVVEDILSLYQMTLPTLAATPLQPALTGSPATLYDCISHGVSSIDGMVEATGWNIPRIQSILSVLEIDGYIANNAQKWQIIS